MADTKINPQQHPTTCDDCGKPTDLLYPDHFKMARKPVTPGALVRRIRRRFASRIGERFHVARTTHPDLGNYWATSQDGTLICWGILDLESWARREGFLAADERLSP